ncbi:MAG: prepilin-type N-terminal cleavage/methylation domain-containing protein [Planctomycetes bacterium]|nr:prepilin-type N-terminal cleavage/methylation domain-containing protein [Planctomycetota bacterium]
MKTTNHAGPRTADFGLRTSDSACGMTLIELLVAFAVLVMLVGMLVALSSSALGTWRTGETRRDTYERTQRVIDQIVRDLRGTYADARWYDVRGRRLMHARFTCDTDAGGTQRLRFVRTGRLDRSRSANDAAARFGKGGPTGYADLWEVAYVLHPPGRPEGLYRVTRRFDRQSPSLLDESALENPRTALWTDSFRLLDDGVLWIGFRFWTQYTTTWDVSAPLRTAPPVTRQTDSTKAPGCLGVGPALHWDSRRVRIDRPLSRLLADDDPDFVYPEIVQVTLVVESRASDAPPARLAEAVEASDTRLRLYDARDLPDADATALQHVRVDDEWIEYRGKSGGELDVSRRGARGTTAARHEAGAAVRHGETFITDVPIPAFREAVR